MFCFDFFRSPLRHSTTLQYVPIQFSYICYFWGLGLMQIVQDLPPPFPLDLPMVLIKPREACSTAEVYKVINRN